MRAVAIFGPGCSAKDLEPFRQNSETTWFFDLPHESNAADAVLIFGGDGTVHRHLAQMVKLRIPVLVVPCGSGNDFARALNLHSFRDSLAAWRRFASGDHNARTIDLGVITAMAESSAPHYFCCVGGVGLDGEVARQANRLPRWLRAHGGYLLSLLPALLRFAPVPMKISGRSGAQPVMVAAFANAPAYGSGMKIAPRALLDDAMLISASSPR